MLVAKNEIGTTASNDAGAQSRNNPKGRHTNIWLPDQPGAWVMALFPALGGIVIGGVSWRNVWLLVAWTLCYCFQFSTARWLGVRSHEAKDARKRRIKIGNSAKPNNVDVKASRSTVDSQVLNRASEPTSKSASGMQRPPVPDMNLTPASHRKRHSNIYFVPAVAYLIATAVVGIPVFIFAPRLLWWTPTYAVLAVLSFVAAWLRRERTLWGNAVSVIAAGAMALLATSLGSRFFVEATPQESFTSRLSPTGLHVTLMTPYPSRYLPDSPLLPEAGVVAAAAFILTEYASVVFVKTMFRKYGDCHYYALSIIYHIALAALGFTAPMMLQNFAGFTPARGTTATTLLWSITATVLLLVALIAPRHKRMKAIQVGGIEAITSLMNLVIIVVALA
ncbi:YwiC-like family protein [Bifidobacterium sp. ESL0784]|uniref:YwiC-like family protein n=1 Tax=Bifidobacterium sp. ESL0784 TaxID=2983231 RepID=UPI0023F9DB66|nr:YwiC-like family protein [Bifidobacterium sp. ESL0784]MDF7640225.1 YwiC-like family protein [Bifidobacterium sp. ESL0784]